MSALGSAVSHMRRWRGDPVSFVRQCLRAEPDAWQVEVLQALVLSGLRRFALKASKGPGKSTLLAWAIWWFLATRLHPKVVCTSITEDNLRDGLWTELAKWRAQSPFLLAAFDWKKERIEAVDHRETWWASARTWPKGGDSSQQAHTLAGVHADNVLFVLDEAGGIPDAVAAAAEGGLANVGEGREALLLIAGNPTHLEGPLYRACTSERALWWVKEISGDPDDPGRAPRVSVDWAREQIAKYGRDNPYVLVNVFGRFPPSSANALIGPNDVSVAMGRRLGEAEYIEEVKILGVDVARFGDDRSVIFARQGRATWMPKVFRNLDLMELTGQVVLTINKWHPDAIFIDNALGAGVIDRLKQLGYRSMGVDFGGKALEVKFANRRAEMWWKMAEWMREGGVLPDVPELTQELTAAIYRFDPHSKLLLEKKEEIKKRTGVSPDLADALALTFAAPVASRDLRRLTGGGQQTKHVYDPFNKGAS